MDTTLLHLVLKEVRSLAERHSRLNASVSVIEQRLKLAQQAERKATNNRIRDLQRELKKIESQPISLAQIMNTWWLRLLAIAMLGLANIDLKHAIALVLQLK